MVPTPKNVILITPRAGAWLWRISATRLRQVALDGALPYRTVRNITTPGRAYMFDACVARWGEPDPDRLSLLLAIDVLQGTGRGAAVFTIYTPRPVVLDADGELAIE